MKKAWLTVRSLVLWAVSGIHFAVVCTFLILLGIFVDPRKNDWPQRVFFRNILRLAACDSRCSASPGFDPQRTSLFICNHVNIFDPFVVYSAIPQFLRGFELESHFKIPDLWLDDGPLRKYSGAGRAQPRRSGDHDATRKAALDSGISLIAFAEGSRTRDGHVQAIQERDFQSRAEIRRADRADEHRRLVRVLSDGQLDAVSRENHGLSARHDRDVEGRTRGCGRAAPAGAGHRGGAGGRIARKTAAKRSGQSARRLRSGSARPARSSCHV